MAGIARVWAGEGKEPAGCSRCASRGKESTRAGALAPAPRCATLWPALRPLLLWFSCWGLAHLDLAGLLLRLRLRERERERERRERGGGLRDLGLRLREAERRRRSRERDRL